MRSADLRAVAAWVNAQQAWSDLPFIVLARRSASYQDRNQATRLSELLGNVTFLERPFHPLTFISVARTAAKGRYRQFDARARIEELRESEDRLRTALMAGRLGSWELDLTTKALKSSPTFNTLFGRDESETPAYDDIISEIHPDDRERVENSVRASIISGSEQPIEFRHIPDGRHSRWIESRARVVGVRSARGPRLVGVSSDITDRKAGEERLRRLNESLEERVAERTAALNKAHAAVLAEIEQRERAEDQLRQSQKLEMIGQLTGGVAHDFNNLLMAVVGNLELLRKRVPHDPKTDRLIEGAVRGAQRGAALTQRLLAFARRQELTVKPTSLAHLVRDMTDLVERSVGSAIELSIDIPQALPNVLVDAHQVEMALLNLVINARDAMPDGGRLNIRLDQPRLFEQAQLPAASYVRLSVIDTGIGMDPDTLRKAAEPFFSTKELGKGTGLGLSMIQGLAVQLGGELRLESKLGYGTTAELWLPMTDQSPERERADDKNLAVSEDRKITVLVVDDDALIAMSTAAMVEDLGHDVFEVNSGSAALEFLKNGHIIDLLITDFSMPKMNGMQLAKAVKDIHPNLPIILATGFAELPIDPELRIPRISKPYQQDQLSAAIAGALKQHVDVEI